MEIVPLYDRLVIQPDAPYTKTPGGLFLPESETKKPAVGTITHVGEGLPDRKMKVKVGDRVVYSRFSVVVIVIDNVDVSFLRESDVVAILPPPVVAGA